jgi:hypothetical protein
MPRAVLPVLPWENSSTTTGKLQYYHGGTGRTARRVFSFAVGRKILSLPPFPFPRRGKGRGWDYYLPQQPPLPKGENGRDFYQAPISCLSSGMAMDKSLNGRCGSFYRTLINEKGIIAIITFGRP